MATIAINRARTHPTTRLDQPPLGGSQGQAAAALASVPSDAPEVGYTKNGRFELTVNGATYTGSLIRDGRAGVRDAVSALRELIGDMRSSIPGRPNGV